MAIKDYERNANRCIRCSLCKWIPQVQIKSHSFASICPSIEKYNFHAYSGGGKMAIALALLKRRLEYTNELLNVIYRCSACGGCNVSCNYMFGLEPLEVIMELRNKCVEDGFGPMPKHREWPDYIRKKHNPYNEDHEKRIAWMQGSIEWDENSDLVYFVGCTPSYRRVEIARETARILNYLDIRFKILYPNEYCCGSPLLKTGQKKEAIELMKQNVKFFFRDPRCRDYVFPLCNRAIPCVWA
jgi:Fe-S oxidoreductase